MQDSKRDTDVYSGLLDSVGEGEGGMIWENGIETCILSCKNRITSLCPMQDTVCLGNSLSVINLLPLISSSMYHNPVHYCE